MENCIICCETCIGIKNEPVAVMINNKLEFFNLWFSDNCTFGHIINCAECFSIGFVSQECIRKFIRAKIFSEKMEDILKKYKEKQCYLCDSLVTAENKPKTDYGDTIVCNFCDSIVSVATELRQKSDRVLIKN